MCYLYASSPGDFPVCYLYDEQYCVEDVVRRYHQGEFAGRLNCQCRDPCVSEDYKLVELRLFSLHLPIIKLELF